LAKIEFDWKKPDYPAVYAARKASIQRIRDGKVKLENLNFYFKTHPVEWIEAFGMTFDPRNLEIGLPAIMPFVLFPKQKEFLEWIFKRWLSREDGLAEKSRDMGLSWLCAAFSVWMWKYYPGSVVGFGSRKESYVDDSSDPKSLFWKVRFFIQLLPKEMRPAGWNEKKFATYMKIQNPENGSMIVGEAGDNIGRGNRTSLYFKDESAYYEHPLMIDAALSMTSNCKIDISTPNGIGNPFYEKRHNGKIPIFTFHWRNDPRKDDVWYQKQLRNYSEKVVAQEIDIDYSASVEGILIPNVWINSAIDAHLRLQIKPSGLRSASLDVADEGSDLNALCGVYGVLVELVEEWSGKGGDIFNTVQQAFHKCDIHQYQRLRYDADGLGAGVRGDARILNESRTNKIEVEAFSGSESVFDPEGEDVKGRKNQDFFANRKAQAWWSLRTRFQNTYRAVVEGIEVNPDDIISLSSGIQDLQKLISELGQPTYSINAVGKILVDKTPDGTKSPNRADSVMYCFASVTKPPMIITKAALQSFARMPRYRS
jgi:hypothetical protein